MTTAYTGLFALDAVFVVVGGVLLYGLGVVRIRPADVRYVGLALFLGWTASGLAAGLAASFGISPGPDEQVLQPLVLVLAGLALRWFMPRVPDRRAAGGGGPARRYAALAGAALLTLSVGAAVAIAWRSGADSSWDVWAMC